VKRILCKTIMSEKTHLRVPSAVCLYLVCFYAVMVVSYYLLPDGLLISRNNLIQWTASSSVLVEGALLLGMNASIAAVIILFNQWGLPRKKAWIALGYLALFSQLTMAAITYGTYSFTMAKYYVSGLGERILRTFDIVHRAGLVEIIGMIIMVAATARMAVTMDDGNERFAGAFKTFQMTGYDKLSFVLGFAMLAVAAIIEAIAIVYE